MSIDSIFQNVVMLSEYGNEYESKTFFIKTFASIELELEESEEKEIIL